MTFLLVQTVYVAGRLLKIAVKFPSYVNILHVTYFHQSEIKVISMKVSALRMQIPDLLACSQF